MFDIREEKREEILNFYKSNQNKFTFEDERIMDMLEEHKEPICITLLQLYTYFDALDQNMNKYYEFYQYLCAKHPHIEKRKILEVASGYVPAISYLITKNNHMEQEITAMDPLNIPVQMTGVKQVNDSFSRKTNIQDYNLLISHCPCGLLDEIFSAVLREKIEFSIQTCQCGTDLTNKEWHYYIDLIIDRLKELEDDGFVIEKEYLNLSDILRSPIITARKRSL